MIIYNGIVITCMSIQHLKIYQKAEPSATVVLIVRIDQVSLWFPQKCVFMQPPYNNISP